MRLPVLLVPLSAFLLSSNQELIAQAAATPSPGEAPVETERVIVTGSNIPTAEEVGPEPVDTYTTEDIEKLGARTATSLVQHLPAITGTAINENINNGGDGRSEVNLRGLFPKETLVLVDGRRVAPVAFAQGATVDLNLVPIPLIDHIDILKDGASALYGSDAVGGVFNVFLRHTFHGTEIGSSYGNTNLGASNDAAEREAYVLTGAGNGKTEVVFFADYYDRDAIYSRDRDISSSANFKRRYGGADQRSINFPGNIFMYDPTTGAQNFYILRPGLNAPTPHSATDVTTSPDYVPASDLPRRDQRFDFARFTAAIPEAERQYLYGSLTHELFGKSLETYADFKYARTVFHEVFAAVPFAPDPFQTSGFAPVSVVGISVPLSNPFNPFTKPDAYLPDGTPVTTNVLYRALEVGPRTTTSTANDYLYDAGLRGNLSELGSYFKNWNFDFGFRYNEDDRDDVSDGIVSKAGLRAALLDPNPATAFNPFARHGNSPAVFDRFVVSTEQTAEASLVDQVLIVSGDLAPLPAGPLSFALGAEHRDESVDDRPDPLNVAFGSIGSQDLQATNARREVWSLFGELRIPVTTPAQKVPGLHSVEFDAAERIEFFSDTNSSERPKFSVRYQPLDDSVTLRATYTEAFHAPDLSDLSPSAIETFSDILDPAVLNPNGKPTEVEARTLLGGQPNLRPEVAYGWNYGVVWTPSFINGLTISLDYYHFDLRDRTNFIDPQFIVDQNFATGGQMFPGQVIRDPVTGRITLIRDLVQNIARTITEGIDYEADYTFRTSTLGHGDLGVFTFTLNGNYLSRYVATIDLGDREREFAGQQSDVFGYLPHHRLYGSLFYDLGGFDVGVIAHFVSQGSDPPDVIFYTGRPPKKIREWTTFDAILSYTFKGPEGAAAARQVPGFAKDGKESIRASQRTGQEGVPISTSAYSDRGWRTWLNGTTITAGINNIVDLDPPFSTNTGENGYDESAFDIKGRYWYVALKRQF